MFLRKRFSIVDSYSCHNFTKGCPSSNYRFREFNKCKCNLSKKYVYGHTCTFIDNTATYTVTDNLMRTKIINFNDFFVTNIFMTT